MEREWKDNGGITERKWWDNTGIMEGNGYILME
jgi:hypothetical protein